MSKLIKIMLIELACFVGLLLIGGVVGLVVYYNNCKTELSINASQIDKSQNILVSWETSKIPDKITIDVKHNDDLVIQTTLSNYQIALGQYEIEAFYGKQEICVTVEKGIFKTTQTKNVSLSTDEYIIAPITATMPVTLFTLSLSEITNNYTTPTFVWFKRVDVWDYTKLKDNVNIIPVLNRTDLVHDRFEGDIYQKVSAWVNELYEINPNSKFNFYYNDYYAYGWMEATIANNIPTSNYTVTLLSDGPSSFLYFNEKFAETEDYNIAYNEMKIKYDSIKAGLRLNPNYIRDNSSLLNSGLREEIYMMVQEEENVNWWLTRISGTMSNNNETVYAELEKLVDENKIYVKDLKTLLFSLSEEEQSYIKALYNFNDAMFEESQKQSKETMVILGTWTVDEHYFDVYVNIMQELYGDTYVFYYKGHPKNPTLLENGKLEKLTDLGLIDIDSTIPAELIFFFNPEAFASGYQTSTFYSITAEKSIGLFNIKKSDLLEDYNENMDIFIFKADSTDLDYGSLITNEESFVIEFNDNEKFDIAIYDNEEKDLKYYKYNNNAYELVNI